MPDPAVFSTGTYDAAAGATRTPGVPSGITNGSLVILCGAIVSNVVPAVPTDFTNKANNNGQTPTTVVHFRKYTGTEGASTYSVSSGTVGTSGWQAYRIEDEDLAPHPFHAAVSENQSASSTTVPAVSLTGVAAGSLLVWVAATSATRSATPPTGFTKISPAGFVNLHVATMSFTAGGDTGSLTGTLSSAAVNSVVLVAIQPVSTSPQPDVIIGGAKKTVTSRSVIINQTKKSVASTNVIINQGKKSII